jgi:hypothetical protein
MKKHYLALACAFALVACGNSEKETASENTETEVTEAVQEETPVEEEKVIEEVVDENMKPQGSIFRCEGCAPGLDAEYYQVAFSKDGKKIVGLWTWEKMQFEKPGKKVKLKILSQEYVNGEISGFTGVFQTPNSSQKYDFGIVEDRFTVSFNGNFEEFEYWKSEN